MENTTRESESEIHKDEMEIEEITRKIINNDYNQLKEVHHDKMVLENRQMILKNKIKSSQFDEYFKIMTNNYDELKQQNKILIEIIKEISKDKGVSSSLQEKIKNLK